jgi:hypothetical protein
MAAVTRWKTKDNAWHLACSLGRVTDRFGYKEISMMKTLVLLMATLFALSAVAIADETPAASAPAGTAATAATGSNDGSSSIVKQSAKKKKKKKKKHHTTGAK